MPARRRQTARDLLRALIRGRFPIGHEFRLRQVYAMESELAKAYPNNKEMQATIRALLQQLRDEGTIEFVDRGLYRRLS